MKNKNLLKIFIVLFLVIITSCNSTNKTTEEALKNEINMELKKMLSEGFIAGEISFSETKGDCPITIKIEDKEGIYYYDPINLTEEFNKEGEKIWFTFARLRRVNRCEKAAPISIMEIQKRN